MNIADNTLKQKLQNVYFIWGSGKTTTANAIGEKYGIYVYHTDDERINHCKNANLKFQPALCRDVPDYWVLSPEDALKWESDIVREFTPMVIADLIELVSIHKKVICEGDIDVDAIIPIISHAVTISNFDDNDQKIHELPRETILFGIKQIIRDDTTSIEQIVEKVAMYFGLK